MAGKANSSGISLTIPDCGKRVGPKGSEFVGYKMVVV